jgi:hypothetical protein
VKNGTLVNWCAGKLVADGRQPMAKKEVSMSSKLGDLFREKRVEKNMKLADTARALGYANMHKGCRKIIEIEDTGYGDENIMQKLLTLYKIQRAEYDEAIDKDVERATIEFEKSSDRIFDRMYLMGFYEKGWPQYVPKEIKTEEEAIKWAVEFIKKNKNECSRKCISLEVSLKIYYCIFPDGEYKRCRYIYTRFREFHHIYNAKHAKLNFYDGTDK